MDENKLLAEEFEANRAHLRKVAYRMLGSRTEADDAVQEAWIRLGRPGIGEIGNLGGWLTTVVARICLDMLRARKARREEPIDDGFEPPVEAVAAYGDPESEIVLTDSVGLAMLVVLESLSPAERIAFVLHDMFDLSFDEIGPIVGRSTEAARQLASRARRRLRMAQEIPATDRARQRRVVDAFLAASRGGDFEGLLAVLDPDVTFRADEAAARLGSSAALRGAEAVAKAFDGRARFARPVLVDGAPGVLVERDERVLLVLLLAFEGDRIAGIEAVADRVRLSGFEISPLSD
ncbi:MAG: sigma-70 family RNA polymerase sigma factor [Oricola sp.]